MIIRIQVIKTLKRGRPVLTDAPPFNSRGSVIDEVASLVEERPTESYAAGNIAPEGVASQ